MKKILVTGGVGFLGTHIIERLLKLKYQIIVLDHPSQKKNIKIKHKLITYFWCDLINEKELKKIKLKNVSSVLHLAAQASGPRSFYIPNKDISINILGTLNIIKFCVRLKIKHIIFASSFVICGDAKKEKIDENMEPRPNSVYANSKLAAENLLKIYAAPNGIKWNILRMFNVYGKGQDLNSADQGIVGIFAGMMMRTNKIIVKGSLKRFRDLVNISDVVDAWMLCLKKKKFNQTYNVGTGKKTTIKNLINSLAQVLEKKDIIIKEIENSKGDLMGSYANLSKIKKDLGFRPKVQLKNGLKEMLIENK